MGQYEVHQSLPGSLGVGNTGGSSEIGQRGICWSDESTLAGPGSLSICAQQGREVKVLSDIRWDIKEFCRAPMDDLRASIDFIRPQLLLLGAVVGLLGNGMQHQVFVSYHWVLWGLFRTFQRMISA